MKKSIILLGVVLALSTQIDMVRASVALRLSVEELAQDADRVTIARVVSIGKSYWGPKHLRIYTEYTFESEKDIAGTGEKRFTIVQPGGRVGRLSQRTDGFPTFQKDVRLILFLRKQESRYRVVGLSQGVFGFHLDGSREIAFQRLEGLSFPGNHGRPMLFDLPDLETRIKTTWGR